MIKSGIYRYNGIGLPLDVEVDIVRCFGEKDDECTIESISCAGHVMEADRLAQWCTDPKGGVFPRYTNFEDLIIEAIMCGDLEEVK